ncbi:Threonine/homoserine/homoserine lactone efflux protein [Thalassotalea agarivorans]|uniref:Threonine/homoserine/homoserine lactone efflux protein n=2 Tax=Thalassotalea agarivorans TaxID=349064 RepID=A0A1I0HFG7_THASX|nr:Threonine/homoserine/homoserine lactone efflux protein [Thalassotalea agarivorans]
MCMTLALTLGMSIGVRKTLWMMAGELLGVATVAICAAIGVAGIVSKWPQLFIVLKIVGAAYLSYIGIAMLRARQGIVISDPSKQTDISRIGLFNQGLITALSNPKGWIFMISLLPPFINPELQFAPQLAALIVIILISELICMLIYANGGKTLGRLLKNKGDLVINRIAGSLMLLVAIWLLFT